MESVMSNVNLDQLFSSEEFDSALDESLNTKSFKYIREGAVQVVFTGAKIEDGKFGPQLVASFKPFQEVGNQASALPNEQTVYLNIPTAAGTDEKSKMITQINLNKLSNFARAINPPQGDWKDLGKEGQKAHVKDTLSNKLNSVAGTTSYATLSYRKDKSTGGFWLNQKGYRSANWTFWGVTTPKDAQFLTPDTFFEG